jgi:hypothetical protein
MERKERCPRERAVGWCLFRSKPHIENGTRTQFNRGEHLNFFISSALHNEDINNLKSSPRISLMINKSNTTPYFVACVIHKDPQAKIQVRDKKEYKCR